MSSRRIAIEDRERILRLVREGDQKSIKLAWKWLKKGAVSEEEFMIAMAAYLRGERRAPRLRPEEIWPWLLDETLSDLHRVPDRDLDALSRHLGEKIVSDQKMAKTLVNEWESPIGEQIQDYAGEALLDEKKFTSAWERLVTLLSGSLNNVYVAEAPDFDHVEEHPWGSVIAETHLTVVVDENEAYYVEYETEGWQDDPDLYRVPVTMSLILSDGKPMFSMEVGDDAEGVAGDHVADIINELSGSRGSDFEETGASLALSDVLSLLKKVERPCGLIGSAFSDY